MPYKHQGAKFSEVFKNIINQMKNIVIKVHQKIQKLIQKMKKKKSCLSYSQNMQTAIDNQIKLSDSTSVLREEIPDNYSKNKSIDDNEDEEEPPENEIIFNGNFIYLIKNVYQELFL
ncbi:hypothetical protein C1645_735854 [Glomus cerebriforme]|uniref:Uncharacterized protein n=1 Tax=Glomus cerebriforme TaxID=658196 RepID=A0A397TDW7_9GLOM|nr:hypothetical protein C1645_735854 [Glomus cerebriforme]